MLSCSEFATERWFFSSTSTIGTGDESGMLYHHIHTPYPRIDTVVVRQTIFFVVANIMPLLYSSKALLSEEFAVYLLDVLDEPVRCGRH